MDNWNIDIARKIYGIENYIRKKFIDIDNEGYLVINIGENSLRVKEIMDRYNLDVAYIRILPAIKYTMDTVYEAYKLVSSLMDYHGDLIPVYPMKVNPTEIVIETIMKHGERYRWGFNTGSIGEIKILEKLAEKYSPRILIYDGIVSENAIRELMKLKSLNWRIIVDVESESELEILSKYPQLDIGLRIKPIVKIHGKWSGSVGLGSKFGLTLNTLHRLRNEYKWLRERTILLHMHPGSQVYKYIDLRNYVSEVRQVYNELVDMGFDEISYVDFGGGMAYPYLDLRDGEEESPDYTITDYFKAIIEIFNNPPRTLNLIYEGGRFIVSSHRIVVARVIDTRNHSAVHSHVENNHHILGDLNDIKEIEETISRVEHELIKLRSIGTRELYEDLVALIREDVAPKIMELISTGRVSIEDVVRNPKVLKTLITPTKRFILNMSIFADIPDSVLVDQYFQVIPVQRLNEKPDVLASIGDLTCDSMGEINYYISPGNIFKYVKPVFTRIDSKIILLPGHRIKLRGVPLHLPSRNENYYIGILDTGAYQDTLAMRHNLIYGAPEVVLDEVDGELKITIIRHEDLYT